jgi:hypothetical protein
VRKGPLLIAATALVTACGVSSPRPRPLRAATLPAGATVLTVRTAAPGKAIAPGFLGLSLEYPAVTAYAGTDPSAVDPVFVQLVRNLTPGQTPVLRIGGDSTDWSWWPAPGLSRPAGATIRLTAQWAHVARVLSEALGAQLILGIDLEADSAQVAGTQARGLLSVIGRAPVAGFELGNEPELYPGFTWDGSGRKGRPRGYGFAQFAGDLTRIGASLPRVPLAEPATGAPKWFPDTGRLLATHPRVRLITLHRYPLQQCFTRPAEPNYPTIAHLLSDFSSRGQADSVRAAVRMAHRRHVPLRIDEMSTISCGSNPQVGLSFASALWVLDALFEFARVGVGGVNIHSYPGATYELFSFSQQGGRWQAIVEPQYYGMLMFAQAAPAGSALLSVSGAPSGLKAWATRGLDGRIRVVLINKSTTRARLLAVRLPGTHGAATLERLRAPGAGASSGVTLGGQSFGSATSTGILPAPHTTVVEPVAGSYSLHLPAASAALLTIP